MEEYKMTQKMLILEHLRRFGQITPLDAIREYGCLRLAARISDLKKDGHNIVTEMMSTVSSVTGRPVQYAKYKLST